MLPNPIADPAAAAITPIFELKLSRGIFVFSAIKSVFRKKTCNDMKTSANHKAFQAM